MSEELKLQLGDRMPAVMQVAAKSVNMTTQEFLKAMENGEIAAEKFLPAFSGAMREMAAPGLEKAFTTTRVAQNRMMAELNLFIKAIMDAGLGELFTEMFNTFTDIIKVLKPIASFIVGVLTPIIKAITFLIRLVFAVLSDLLTVFKKVFGTEFHEFTATLGKGLGYILSIVTGVGTLIKGAVRLVSKFSSFKNILQKVVDLLKMVPGLGNFVGLGEKAVKVYNTAGRASAIADMPKDQSMFDMIKNFTADINLNMGPGAKDFVTEKVRSDTSTNVNMNTRG